MWHPFKALIDKIMLGLEESFAEHDRLPPPSPPPEKTGTKFERALQKRFDTWRDKPQYHAIMVSIENGGDDYLYMDPLSRSVQNGTFHVSVLETGTRFEDAVRMENNVGKLVVMMLDLKGPPLEEQIPGWKAGTIEFPDRFLREAVITVQGGICACRGAGIIVDDYQMLPRITPIHVQNHEFAAQAVQQTYSDLPHLKPAFIKGVSGKPVPAPSHIRGILINDSGSQEPAPSL